MSLTPGMGIHDGVSVRERRAAAEVARHASGPTLVLGSPLGGLVEALWERVPRVVHALEGPVERFALLRRAGDASVSGYATCDLSAELSGGWETLIVDADGPWGGLDVVTWLALVAPGGVLLVVGTGNRPLEAVRAPMRLGPRRLLEGLTPIATDVYPVPLPVPNRYLVHARRPGPDPTEPVGGEASSPAAWLAGTDPEDDPDTGRAGSDPAAASGPEDDPVHGDDVRVEERLPVTVIIPSAGRSPWLADAVSSVLDGSARPARLLVVSDGGGDPVRHVLHRFGDAVDLLEVAHGGQAAAMNAGLRTVTTDHVAWLDDDDRFLPRKLELQWRDLAAHPEAGFSVTDHYAIDPTGALLEWRPMVRFDPEQVFRLLLGGSFFLGPTVMAATARYRTVGDPPHDESLERAADYAMWFELAAQGPVRTVPLALAEIRRHGGNALTPDRVAKVRRSAQVTLTRVIGRWPLERFFPAIEDARYPDQEAEARALALLERGGHLLRIGLVDLALADLDAGLALRPEDARLRHFQAMALLEAGSFADAAEAFRGARRVGAPPAEVASGIGTAVYFEGDRAGARRAFQEAVAADPRFPLGRYNLAALDVEEGKGGRDALEVARSLLARGRPHGYLLSPWPPLDGMEAELLRLRRAERGLETR